ncbi:GNAT family N-acetyltransferase [Pseudalkalibacillus sp. NRS-1564]|uniref:GNAT family N-acetyltransferase n=1 Tax=Pseudalkalibacillus sp. NRS-1564 TaxID=3233900 RepID=UPI003D2CB951
MRVKEENIYLVKAEKDHISALKSFTLDERQLAFTSMPVPAYEKCQIDHDRFPVVIMEKDQPVGFFVLDRGDDTFSYSDNTKAVLLRAYSINRPEQGRGIAKASLQLLEQFVKRHFPNCHEIVLGVNEDNEAAKKIYLGAGFIHTNKKKNGRSGPQAILKYPVI